MTTTKFTPSHIASLRELAEKATKGPWRQHLVDDTTVIDATGEPIAETFPEGGVDEDIDFATDTEQREANAAFIAAARAALPAALDEIERLRAENEKLREALTKIVRTEVTGLGKTYTAILNECLAISRRALDGGEHDAG